MSRQHHWGDYHLFKTKVGVTVKHLRAVLALKSTPSWGTRALESLMALEAARSRPSLSAFVSFVGLPVDFFFPYSARPLRKCATTFYQRPSLVSIFRMRHLATCRPKIISFSSSHRTFSAHLSAPRGFPITHPALLPFKLYAAFGLTRFWRESVCVQRLETARRCLHSIILTFP